MALTQVSTSGIKDGSVSTADLADGSISTSKVADGSISTAKVADDAITADKLNNTGVTAGSYTLSSVTVDAQGRVTAASSGTPVDADKIIEGNTEVETVDTGSDGHIKATTEGSERLRVGPAGQVGIGGANYGTSGQVFMSGGASAAPTWGDVSSSPTFEATADGAISDGDPVIVQTDGTVKKAQLILSESFSRIGNTDSTLVSATTSDRYAAASSTNGNVIVYIIRNSSESLVARAGYIDSNGAFANYSGATETIDPGTTSKDYPDICYDPNTDRFIIAYSDKGNSEYGEAMVLQVTVTGSNTATMTRGTSTTFSSTGTVNIRCAYDDSQDKVVISYIEENNSRRLKAIAATVTGGSTNSLSFGTSQIIALSNIQNQDLIYHSGINKTVAAYRSTSNGYGYLAAFTLSGTNGTTITSGIPLNYAAHNAFSTSLAYNVNDNKVIVAYYNGSSNDIGVMKTATVASNGTITTSSAVTFHNAGTRQIGVGYEEDIKKTLLVYKQTSNNDTYAQLIDSSGTNPTVNTGFILADESQNNFNLQEKAVVQAHSGTGKMLVFARETQNYSNATMSVTVVGTTTQNTNLTVDNFVGISNGAYADGATATIQTFGAVDDAQSGLTAGQKYYVQGDGSLGTSQTEGTGTLAGIALSATKLLISGN